MVHLDEAIPQELDVHFVLSCVWQLTPITRIARIQIQIDLPPIIEVVLDVFAEATLHGLIRVEFVKQPKEHFQLLRIAWLLAELSESLQQIAKLAHDVTEYGYTAQQEKRHDQPLIVRPWMIIAEADRR